MKKKKEKKRDDDMLVYTGVKQMRDNNHVEFTHLIFVFVFVFIFRRNYLDPIYVFTDQAKLQNSSSLHLLMTSHPSLEHCATPPFGNFFFTISISYHIKEHNS